MKIYVDDIRNTPDGFTRCYSVNETIDMIQYCENNNIEIEVIDLDHDAGEYYKDGGDYIRILDWLEYTNREYPIRIHSQNSVGVMNMRRIINHNRWRLIE